MNTVDKLIETLEKEQHKCKANPDIIKLQNFLKKMNRLGLVKKQDYNIPPVDTLGRKFYENCRASSK
ncbi:MAG: hypothetical protein HZC49_04180 [Nitrospirae bacterium]|nr:hypothetical protein [Nitrospirota bacterium]